MAVDAELRVRKKLATYRALATAARELTLSRGLDEVTVDDIAAAATVSPRTFFNYFSSKEEAIVGQDPTLLAQLSADLRSRPADESPLEALGAVLFANTDDPDQTAHLAMLRVQLVQRYPSLLPRFLAAWNEVERVLVAAMADRLGIDPDVDPYPRTVVVAAVGVVRSTIAWWNEHQHVMPLADALRRGFGALASGFPAPAAVGGP